MRSSRSKALYPGPLTHPNQPPKDDRVLPETRIVGAIIVPFLIVAFIMLYGFPGNTDTLFAWTIRPDMTPLIMGAGYISGSYFFCRVVTSRSWHQVHLGFLPITAFTWFMAVATFMHLDRFHQGHISFYAWIGLYIFTPAIVPIIWLRNSSTDPGMAGRGELMLSRSLRYLVGGAGVIQLAIALVLLISPDLMVNLWPWKLTPLTAQVIGGWFALPSVVAILMALDARWSAIKITLESQLIGLGLMLVAIIRAWADFDGTNLFTFVFIGGIAVMFLGLLALYFYMEGLRRQPRSFY